MTSSLPSSLSPHVNTLEGRPQWAPNGQRRPRLRPPRVVLRPRYLLVSASLTTALLDGEQTSRYHIGPWNGLIAIARDPDGGHFTLSRPSRTRTHKAGGPALVRWLLDAGLPLGPYRLHRGPIVLDGRLTWLFEPERPAS